MNDTIIHGNARDMSEIEDATHKMQLRYYVACLLHYGRQAFIEGTRGDYEPEREALRNWIDAYYPAVARALAAHEKRRNGWKRQRGMGVQCRLPAQPALEGLAV